MTECDSVFMWSRFDNWSHRVVEWFEEVVPEASRDAATQDPMMYFDLTKDPDANSQTDPTRRLSRKFKEAYSKIRLFHACRPGDIGSYIQKGLLPLSTIDADNGTRILFRSQKTPLVSERALSDAVAELSRENRGGYLYLSLDDIGLVRDAGHYLIYGSEYHGALAATLSKRTGVDCLVVLQKIGIPTMFACNVPLGYASELALPAQESLEGIYPSGGMDQLTVPDLLLLLEVNAAILDHVLRAAPASARAFHRAWVDPSGFAGMGCDEILIHTADIAAGFEIDFRPPEDLSSRVLARLFPWAPTDIGHWESLLWANGRIALPESGLPRDENWRWHPAPLNEWDGRIPRRE